MQQNYGKKYEEKINLFRNNSHVYVILIKNIILIRSELKKKIFTLHTKMNL